MDIIYYFLAFCTQTIHFLMTIDKQIILCVLAQCNRAVESSKCAVTCKKSTIRSPTKHMVVSSDVLPSFQQLWDQLTRSTYDILELWYQLTRGTFSSIVVGFKESVSLSKSRQSEWGMALSLILDMLFLKIYQPLGTVKPYVEKCSWYCLEKSHHLL